MLQKNAFRFNHSTPGLQVKNTGFGMCFFHFLADQYPFTSARNVPRFCLPQSIIVLNQKPKIF